MCRQILYLRSQGQSRRRPACRDDRVAAIVAVASINFSSRSSVAFWKKINSAGPSLLSLHKDSTFQVFEQTTLSGYPPTRGGYRLIFQKAIRKQFAIQDLSRRNFQLSLTRGDSFKSRQTLRARQAAQGDRQPEGREIGEEAAAVLSQIWEAPNILQLPPSLSEMFSNSITRRLPADNGYCTTPCRTQHTLPWVNAEAATQETAGSDRDEVLFMTPQRPQVPCRSVSQDPANNGRLISLVYRLSLSCEHLF